MYALQRGMLPIIIAATLATIGKAHCQAESPVPAAPAFGQTTNPTATPASTATLGVTIVVPPVYESTVSSIGALATAGEAALKSYRADARTLAIRSALTKKLLAGGTTVTTINLDKADMDATLGEIALLCAPRHNYISSAISLNYLNTLVQNINAVSAPAAAPTDIGGALKLLFASSGYAITDKVKVDQATLDDLAKKVAANCQADLSSYAEAYYGAEMPTGPHAAAAAATGGVDTFAFLGPIGTLIDTFLSILQPILIDASKIVDQARRQAAIQTALEQNESKITTTGKLLATAVDNYAASARYNLVGVFVEQLVMIREMPIDVTNVADCKNLAPTNRLPSGAPNAAFVGCWNAAWAKLQPQVENLKLLGDSYDALADAGDVNASKLFGTIMANYKAIKNGQIPLSNVVLNDMTEFVTFANDITNALSKNNLAALKSAATAASK
jgi:hypothetical protein